MTDKPDQDARTIGGRCSICQRPSVHAFRPFCSKRCADVDLSRWLTGAYAVAGSGADADEDGDGLADLPPSPRPLDAEGRDG